MDAEGEEAERENRPESTQSQNETGREPDQKIERILIEGIPIDAKNAIEIERFNKVTSGRRKIPLPLIFRSGALDVAASSGQDIYIAVVCYDTCTVGQEKVLKVSNLLFSGSAEALVHISDAEGPIKPESLKSCCILILNPSVIGTGSLRVPSLKACLRLGTLTGLDKCAAGKCDKPVLVDRDGSLCYKHSSEKTIRVQVGGSSLNFEVKTGSDQQKAVRTSVEPLSVEARKAKAEEKQRTELLAKKKTAMLLLNRTSGPKTHAVMRLSVGDDKALDIGEINEVSEAKEKIARYQALKRRRETLDRTDEAKQRREVKVRKEAERMALNANPVEKGPRKSISEQLADVIKAERGF